MASNDIAVTKADIESLKIYIDGRIAVVEKRLDGIEQSISEVKTEVLMNTAKVDMLRNSIQWSVATLVIVIGIVGFSLSLAPMFLEMYKDRKKQATHDDIREIVREEFAKLRSSLPE